MFATEQFGYNVKRDINLSASKYFNQQLLNYSQKFAGDSDYIFFAHAVLQRIQLNNKIKIAMRKVSSDILTVGMLSRDLKETLRQVMVMVKQLGVPTFFLTLSCEDLR